MSETLQPDPRVETARRRFLAGLGALPLTAALSQTSTPAQAASVKSSARIVIAGAGAAGLAAASQLAARLQDASITVIDARKEHYYQPGFTLVAAGIKPQAYTVSNTGDYLPQGVEWVTERVAEIDPEGNKVVTESGKAVAYDFLILATGLELNYAGIEGMDTARIGQNGMGSIYHSPQAATATWQAMSAFADKGGIGVFGRPAGEMKCAGAPLKYTFITDDHLRRRGNRGKAEIVYMAQSKSLFGVPIVAEKVRMLFQDRGVKVNHEHVLQAIDLDKRIATYKTLTGTAEQKYDFINVVPPMRAPEVVRNSPLPWTEGPFAADGWVEVDRDTLRHKRYPNVFGVGDIAGVPKGKTAASVKWQVPVAVSHLIGDIAGKASSEVYNGYTSCPLITRLGQAMLIEFDYKDNLIMSFPGVIAPLEELWISWVMKTMALKPTYISMLRGRA
ncbi:MAG TPA: pyridine nucleotide-disulfide oxidoreductase [Hydrogenophaga sp.]|uniref:NAD(P)/FAD-dependent oxidoreductase n=1 Tax=Hydrogenophaga sp. TaxID=1904254 RepID=UPI0008CC43F3|nr:FAD/NAD(P)-binding oxidoreductase [Hydrogenophaga sp.]OGA76662.1 MAG: pyridine nucleotide-disulfide oxidoreductase [Burkholderiales bacterium GWE1_65_30]OGA91578.1 MAG: pyridine nucleotide-disulfide oxidoreductase [Burkholderiales bacterium GWF1_66_17]HAX19680.1 pyridine nucleotide-disulfide oxidoreductase [Hydrogenophaga sp.]HBU20261.1 pyridine nucleotide-disulfide oxidoreductase [Hydrogenophaga sp.]